MEVPAPCATPEPGPSWCGTRRNLRRQKCAHWRAPRLRSIDASPCPNAVAALANARTFGGEDYVGFHTMMALAPAVHMSAELPEALRPLPVLKVLYRNTNR